MQRIASFLLSTRGFRTLGIGILAASPILVATNVLHIRSTELGDPYGINVDFALVVAAIALKWFLLVSSIIVLRVWFGDIYQRPKKAACTALAIAFPLVVLTLVLAANRGAWASRLSNDSEKYHSFVSEEDDFASWDANYSRVSWLWHNGITQTAECLLVMAIVAMLAMLGVQGGRSFWWISIFAVPGILFAYSLLLQLFVFDFDVFHGEIWSGAVLLDLIWPLYVDPYSFIASLYYATFASFLVLMTWTRGNDPACIEGRSATAQDLR